jgi:hypothetical protein
MASMEIGLPGLNSSQTAGPFSGLKAIWQSLSSGSLPVVSVSRSMKICSLRMLELMLKSIFVAEFAIETQSRN